MKRGGWSYRKLGVDWVVRKRNMPTTTASFWNAVWETSKEKAMKER